jgi:hypothetical protein
MADESASSTDDGSSDSMAKKSTAKKSAAKKSATKKSTAKKSTAKKSPAKKSATKTSTARKSTAKQSRTSAPRASARPRPGPVKVAAAAAQQLLELTGREAEGVTGLEKTDDGWKVRVEVLEVRRIPETTDVLALYEVEVDSDGDMVGYHRVRRYTRGTPGEE